MPSFSFPPTLFFLLFFFLLLLFRFIIIFFLVSSLEAVVPYTQSFRYLFFLFFERKESFFFDFRSNFLGQREKERRKWKKKKKRNVRLQRWTRWAKGCLLLLFLFSFFFHFFFGGERRGDWRRKGRNEKERKKIDFSPQKGKKIH